MKKDSNGVLSSISNFVGSSQAEPQVETHWISESGVMDIFVLLGPKPKDVSRQYGLLTGNTPLPPHFSLAYHQCRWNYNDQEDVRTVANNFDNYDIPMVCYCHLKERLALNRLILKEMFSNISDEIIFKF